MPMYNQFLLTWKQTPVEVGLCSIGIYLFTQTEIWSLEKASFDCEF